MYLIVVNSEILIISLISSFGNFGDLGSCEEYKEVVDCRLSCVNNRLIDDDDVVVGDKVDLFVMVDFISLNFLFTLNRWSIIAGLLSRKFWQIIYLKFQNKLSVKDISQFLELN